MNKLKSFIITAFLSVSLAVLLWGCQTKQEAGDLENSFVNPPNSGKPWAYWVWFAGGGRWSKEGATADLEAMKRVGINGLLSWAILPPLPQNGARDSNTQLLKQPEGFSWGSPDKDTKMQPVYYHDLAVLAFPTPEGTTSILNLKEKALFARDYCSGYGGGGIALLVLPKLSTMTPSLLRKIKQLVEDGATVVGPMRIAIGERAEVVFSQ